MKPVYPLILVYVGVDVVVSCSDARCVLDQISPVHQGIANGVVVDYAHGAEGCSANFACAFP